MMSVLDYNGLYANLDLVEYVYYHRREQIQQGYHENRPAPGVYSENVQTGGLGRGYGTMGPPQ